MNHIKYKMLIGLSLLVLIVMFQNFSFIKYRSIQSVPDTTGEISAEELKESLIDSMLYDLRTRYAKESTVESCFDKRISCAGNRNHDKCLDSKVSHFIHCSNLDGKVSITNLN